MIEVNQAIEAQILSRSWFYHFRLPSGRVTDSYLPDETLKIHDTRETMLFQVLDPEFEGRWDSVNCIDLACHEGFFSTKLALKGCKEVLGIDGRHEHIENANLIRQAYGLQNLRFAQGEIQHLDPQALGKFDVTLLYGILYHLEDIVGALRLAYALTNKVCMIETQIAPNLSGLVDWGSYKYTKPIVGSFAIVDESDELAAGNREANLTPITLLPSLPGLLWLLNAVGFARAEVVVPPVDAYEQIATGKRVVVAAFID
ncbi:MAG: methyltransferase domain-containing protein [Chloroflexota bacterium]